MNRVSILRVLLTVLFAVTFAAAACPETANADTASAELLIVAGSDQAALVAQDTRFDARLQLQSSLIVGAGARWQNGVELVGGVSVTHGVPTSVALGYSYAGWTGRTVWARIGLAGQGRLPEGFLRGIRFTAFGVLAGYDSTYLLSFFPVLEISPTLSLPLTRNLAASIELPLGWQIRRDLSVQLGETFEMTGTPYMGFSTLIVMTLSPAISTPRFGAVGE
jgi:hypothetical protein